MLKTDAKRVPGHVRSQDPLPHSYRVETSSSTVSRNRRYIISIPEEHLQDQNIPRDKDSNTQAIRQDQIMTRSRTGHHICPPIDIAHPTNNPEKGRCGIHTDVLGLTMLICNGTSNVVVASILVYT